MVRRKRLPAHSPRTPAVDLALRRIWNQPFHSSPFSKAFDECAKSLRVRSMPLLSIKSCRTRLGD
jgi:hypothetical protein